MNVQATPTTEEFRRALAHVYGCGLADVKIDGLVDITISTDLEGAKRAQTRIKKVREGSAWGEDLRG